MGQVMARASVESACLNSTHTHPPTRHPRVYLPFIASLPFPLALAFLTSASLPPSLSLLSTHNTNIHSHHTPTTQALGKVMGSELPHIPGGSDQVLYPASVKASTDLQDSLTAAGFKVQRINTYNTVSQQSTHRWVLDLQVAA